MLPWPLRLLGSSIFIENNIDFVDDLTKNL
jgi:hypothetical protein